MTPRGSSEAEIHQSLHTRRQSMLAHVGIPHDSGTPDLDLIPALLDPLPEFMKLFYTLIPEHKAQLTEVAVIFMLQAAIEQVLIYGQDVAQAANEAFSWGWYDSLEPDAQDPASVTWCSSKGSMKILISEAINHLPLARGFEKLLQQYPLFSLDGLILEALESYTDTLTAPILVQLDGGKLEGLTEKETIEFKNWVGIL